jgi:Glycosyl transferases group 1
LKQFDHVIVGLEGSVGIVGELIGRACHFMPAAVDALRFSPYPSPPPRVIDLYSFGRRRESIHHELLSHAAGHGLFYLYETLEGGGNIVSDYRQHREQIAAIAKRSQCIMVAPAKFDRPEERGTQNELANRYYEASAAGAVMIGEAPDCESFRRLFDWPQAVVEMKSDGSDVVEVMTRCREQPGLLRTLGCRNAEQALRRHDWVYRWREVFRIAGLAPTSRMNERIQRLNSLADLAKRDAA